VDLPDQKPCVGVFVIRLARPTNTHGHAASDSGSLIPSFQFRRRAERRGPIAGTRVPPGLNPGEIGFGT
jgi:hypothetical protein